MSNGIGLSPDGATLYHVDSTTKGIWVHDVAADGSVSNRRHIGRAAFERGIPDGMCVDVDGNLWVAHVGGRRVVKLSPTGDQLDEIPVPAKAVTSVAFGGPDAADMYIVTADHIDEPDRRGCVFRCRPGVTGVLTPLARSDQPDRQHPLGQPAASAMTATARCSSSNEPSSSTRNGSRRAARPAGTRELIIVERLEHATDAGRTLPALDLLQRREAEPLPHLELIHDPEADVRQRCAQHDRLVESASWRTPRWGRTDRRLELGLEREPGCAVVDRQRDPTTRPQHPSDPPEHTQWLRREEDHEPARDGIEGRVGQFQVLGIADPHLDVRQRSWRQIGAESTHHRRRHVVAEHRAALTHRRQRRLQHCTAATRQIQHVRSRLQVGGLDETRPEPGEVVDDRVVLIGDRVERTADRRLHLTASGHRPSVVRHDDRRYRPGTRTVRQRPARRSLADSASTPTQGDDDMANQMRDRWAAGGTALGAWISFRDPIVAETAASLGFDYVCIDLQHGLNDYDGMANALAAMARTGATPLVRVPWNEPGIIGRALDAGAAGVIIPMVNSVDEAQRAASACHYWPTGTRSFGPIAPAGAVASPGSRRPTSRCCASR